MSDKNTKHSEVSRLLSNEILAGKHPVGKRLPSEVQLAAKFKVSRPTIGRALVDLQ
ncbi:MAG: GntR family transcriptional regulator, partial [Verrucomicrobiaceae bacterium]